MPLFEGLTPETILERILSRMDTELQTREGSYAYDQAAPISFEIWRVLMTLEELIEAFYVNENSGPYLDAHARLFAMSRREGARAAAKMTFTGREGTAVPAGTVFYAGGAMEFRTTADAVILNGSAEGYVLAAEAGNRYNVPAGAIDQMARTIPGLEKFESAAAEGGADPESDGDLFRRLTVAAKLQGRTATTPQMIKEVAETLLGVPVEVIEIFDEYTVIVSTPAGYLPRARAVRLRAQLRDIIPAHLDFQVVIPAAAEAAVALALGPRFSGAALAPYRPDIPPVAMGWTCAPWGVCSVTTLPQAKTEEDMEWVIKS